MNVLIKAVLAEGPASRVEFFSRAGGAVARWHGPTPRVGQTHDVEFALEDERVAATDEIHDSMRAASDDRVVFIGEVEQAWEDAVLSIRVAGEGALLVDVPRDATFAVGQRVAVGKADALPD
jgi:hypothetical protein